MLRRYAQTTLFPLLSLLLVSCGGGGSGNNDPSGGTTPPPANTNTAPIADAGTNQNINKGQQVSLNGSSSSDADGDSLAFTWTLSSAPANSSATLSSNTGMTSTFVADIAGNYIVSLVVNDGVANSVTNTISVIATNTAPLANAGSDTVVTKGVAITLDGSGSADANGDALTYTWAVSSRPDNSNAIPGNENTVNGLFTPDLTGMYQLSLIVNDGDFNSEADFVTIEAVNTAPIANAGIDKSINTGITVTLDGSQSRDENGDNLIYLWSLTNKPEGSDAVLSADNVVSPVFTADIDGNYVFSLAVNDGEIQSATDTVTFTATTVISNTAPVAQAGDDQSIPKSTMVQLDGSQSHDANGNTITYRWTLNAQPDGSTASLSDTTLSNPTFTADTLGDFVLTLVVNDGQIDSNIDSVTITAFNNAPVASAGQDQSINTGAMATLDSSGSTDANDDTLNFKWTMDTKPTGSTASLSSSTAAEPTFRVDLDGIYVLSLIVNDGLLDSESDQVMVVTKTVSDNTNPIADAGESRIVNTGSQVILDGSNSSDADGNTLTYRWTVFSIPSDSNATLLGLTSVQPVFTPDVNGHYSFTLVVNDSLADSGTATVTITATNQPPIAHAGDDQTVKTGTLVALDGSASADADGSALTYLWKIIGAPTSSTASLSDNTTANPTITPDINGDYFFSLVVNDGSQDSAIVSVAVTAFNTAPVADAGSDQTVANNNKVSLTGRLSSDVENDPLSYQWTVESKPVGANVSLSSDTSFAPTFTPTTAGDYLFSLKVNDGLLDSDADTVKIAITNNNPIADAGRDQFVPKQTQVTLDGINSFDPDGENVSYRWSMDSTPLGSNVSLSSLTNVTTTLVPDVGGIYIVSLVVNDGADNSTADTVLIRASNTAPVANAGGNQTIITGAVSLLNGDRSTDPDGDTLTYKWSISSAPQGSNAALENATSIDPSLATNATGTYVISLTVSDGSIASSPDEMTVTTRNTDPVAKAGDDQSIYIYQTGTLDGTASSDIEGQTLTYLWTLETKPTDSTATLSAPTSDITTLTPDIEGDYVVSLVVSDGFADSAADIVTIAGLELDLVNTSGGAINLITTMGQLINGTVIFCPVNGASYHNEGIWRNNAAKFEAEGFDISVERGALNDDGTIHSPVYGFAADGYPLHGPYYASGVLAKSSWIARDYDDATSASGCGVAGQRTCLLVDQYDVGKGTVLTTTGPTTKEIVPSISGNSFVTTSGYYFEDFYHDSTLSALSGEYLDKHNGHSHDNLGYHYHLTVIDNNSTLESVFPYSIGPTLYGELPAGGMAICQ